MDLRIIYFVAVFISTLELFFFYEKNVNKINNNFLILFLTTLLSNSGYALSVYAKTLEGAIYGNIISYVGSIFTIYFMLIVILEICKIKLPVIIRMILLTIALVIVLLICDSNESNLFFVNQRIETLYGMTVIVCESGPLLIVYIVYLALINVASMFFVIYAISTKRRVSKKILWTLLILLIIGTSLYVIPLALGIPLNFMVYTYIIMVAVFTWLSVRMNMYDISVNLINVYKKRGAFGYIVFDLDKHFLACDELLYKVFPELNTVLIDSHIPANYQNITNQLNLKEDKWKWNEHIEVDFAIESNGFSLIATIHELNYKKKTIGYLFEFRDNTKQQNYIDGINKYNKDLSKIIREKTTKIMEIQDSIIKGMAMMVESRDNSTGGHIARTSDCVRIFVTQLFNMGTFSWCTFDFCERIIKAAPMHDLGKIAVDDSILRKPGKYTPEEYEIMKIHPSEGAKIVDVVLKETTDDEFKQIARNVAHYHHEKWNGQGYPNKLSGEEIPIEARIMALVDVFDALVSKRCYKEAKSFDEAFAIIQDGLGEHFDPIIGEIFLKCRPEFEEYYTNQVVKD